MDQHKPNTCPKCGKMRWEEGRLYKRGSLEDIRFRAVDAPPLSMKKRVEARVCQACGYIELRLSVDDLDSF